MENSCVENRATYVNKLNLVFTRFERHDFSLSWCHGSNPKQNVRKNCSTWRAGATVLEAGKGWQGLGSDSVPAKALKACAEQLALILQQLFQATIDSRGCTSPMERIGNKDHCKSAFPIVLNNFRPVVLTSNVMKCLENILRDYVWEQRWHERSFAVCIL